MPTTTAKAPTPKKLATRSEAARDRLDAWVREVVAWHFSPGDGHALLARLREARGLRPAQGGEELRRPRPLRPLPGRVAARRPRAALGAEGLRGQAGLHLRDRRLHRRAQVAHQHRRLPHRLRDVQRDPARRVLPQGRRLAARRPFAARAGCAWPSSTSASYRGGICFMVDLDPRWVIKLIKARRDGADGEVQAARRRPGAHAPARPTTTSAACSRPRSCSRRSARRSRSRSSGSRASSAAAPR